MTRAIRLFLTAGFCLAALPAAAQSADPLDDNPAVPGRTHESFTFRELDLNEDGRLARTETAFREPLWRAFARADGDGSGTLSRAEYDAWANARRG